MHLPKTECNSPNPDESRHHLRHKCLDLRFVQNNSPQCHLSHRDQRVPLTLSRSQRLHLLQHSQTTDYVEDGSPLQLFDLVLPLSEGSCCLNEFLCLEPHAYFLKMQKLPDSHFLHISGRHIQKYEHLSLAYAQLQRFPNQSSHRQSQPHFLHSLKFQPDVHSHVHFAKSQHLE
ncbi:Uncharacterised protein [Acinetobacter baumannii]|nr:Uncharacterised protein [Acinetobacter baumannii]